MKKQTWQALVRKLAFVLLAILRLLPWRAAQALGDRLGTFGYRISRRYRDVADKNLQIAFGDTLTEAERQALTKRVFQSFARSAMEFLKAPQLTPHQIRTRVKSEVGMAPAQALLSRGRGLIVVTAHFGNWELLARRATIEDISLLVVARQTEDGDFNKLTDALRASGGYTVHPRGASPKGLLQQLRRNGAVAILPDQKSEDVFVPFFGRLAGTVAGPAILALKTGAPILPMFCPRQPDGSYCVEFAPEVDTTQTGDTEADTRRIMADITRAVEDAVRRHPEQWLWLHDRWRVPPPEAPDSEAQPHSYKPFSHSDGGKVPKADRGPIRA